jgi:hypothetical protein
MFADISENMRSEKDFTAQVLDRTCSISHHLLREWDDLVDCTSEGEAKLVLLPTSFCEEDCGERSRGRQSEKVQHKVRVRGDQTSTLLKTHVLGCAQKVQTVQAPAKYTDEYPNLSIDCLTQDVRQYNFQEFSEWIHLKDLIVTIKVQGKRREIVRPEVESTYRLLVDFCQTLILYGFVIDRNELLEDLRLVHLQWCRLLKFLDFNFIKLAKYKLAAFAAFAKESDTYPKSPFPEEIIKRNALARPDMIFNRKFHNYFKSLPQSTSTEKLFRMSLIDTICRGLKKGADRPSDELVHKSNLDTVECFASERPPILVRDFVEQDGQEEIDDQIVIHVDMTEEILRTTDEIIRPNSKDFSPSWHRMPSLSACYENKFSNAGSVLTIKNILDSYSVSSGGSITRRSWYGAVRCGVFRDMIPALIQNPEDPNGKPIPLDYDGSFDISGLYGEFSTNYHNTSDPIDVDRLFSDLARVRRGFDPESETRKEFERRIRRLGGDLDRARSPIGHHAHMTVVGLKEALKIRGITKGEALENWLLQPLQKYLAQKLLKIPCFALTGRPLSADDLEKTFRELPSGEFFLSGDYDNATNKMYSHYTRTCIRRICENLSLSEDFSYIAETSLCDNVVEYKYIDRETKKLTAVRKFQKNAQPMGKVLSFVVLCIINAAVCRKSKELDASGNRIPIPLKHFKAQINGDDCVFTLRSFDSWEKTCKCVGLENSVGKTFFSRAFIEMNSRTYILNHNHPDVVHLTEEGTGNGVVSSLLNLRFDLVPFVNFGLLKGLVRSSAVDDEETRFERIACLGECHTDLLTHNHHFYKELDFLFKRYNKDLLDDVQLTGIPYYVPKWLGGLGLDPGAEPWDKISLTQRKCASIIYSEIREMGKRPQHVSINKTCLVHDEVLEILDEIKASAGLEPVRHQKLELETGEIVDLESENAAVYTDLVEHVWRHAQIDATIKTDRDESILDCDSLVDSLEVEFSRQIMTKSDLQICLSKRKIKRALRKNRYLWMSAYERHFNLSSTINWHKIWSTPRKWFDGFLPIVRADSVRDQRNRYLTGI